MEIRNWLERVLGRVSGVDPGDGESEPESGWYRPRGGSSLWQGLAGRSMEMMAVQEEVAAEQQGRVVIAGRDGQANRSLLARARAQPVTTTGGPVCREGFFTLIQLPSLANPTTDSPVAWDDERAWDGSADAAWRGGAGPWHTDDLLNAVAGTDLVLYLLRQEAGWQPADAQWYARLRASGVPMLPVIVAQTPERLATLEPTRLQEMWQAAQHEMARFRAPLGIRPAFVWEDRENAEEPAMSAATAPSSDPAPDLAHFVERILGLRPRLAIPLAQEIPCCRPLIATRVIRSGVLTATLLGAEPVPLLDLPLFVAVQWKMALQLAAIYGRPGLDYRSREMIGTVGVSLSARYIAQQALKVIPIVGWAISAALSGSGSWVLGQSLLRYYQEDQLITLRLPVVDWRERLRPPRRQINQLPGRAATALQSARGRLGRIRLRREDTGDESAGDVAT